MSAYLFLLRKQKDREHFELANAVRMAMHAEKDQFKKWGDDIDEDQR